MKKLIAKIIKNYFPIILDVVVIAIKTNPESNFVKGLIKISDKVDEFYSEFKEIEGQIEQKVSETDINDMVKDLLK